jgi:hypothetical protein
MHHRKTPSLFGQEMEEWEALRREARQLESKIEVKRNLVALRGGGCRCTYFSSLTFASAFRAL